MPEIKAEYTDLLTYNAFDSAITFNIMEKFWREVYQDEHEATYERTIDLLQPLMYMMVRGIAVNLDNLREASKQTEQDIERYQEELVEFCGRYINPLSPKQVSQYFYVDKGIQPYTNKEGRPTTDDKAMARLARGTAARPGLRSAKLIQQLRGLHKLKGTYLDITFDADGRFRTSCNPRGTKFGRISTGKTIYNTGMNMQNLPVSFKRFLVPDPGYLMIELDKRQAEWVVVAYVSGDVNMIAVLEEGGDPHLHTGSLITGADKELIKRENKAVGHATDPTEIERLRRDICPEIFKAGLPYLPRIFSIRQGGKKSNHALNYDESPRMFAIHNEMPEKDAKTIHKLYHRAYPGIAKWHSFIQTELRNDRTLINCFGRKCRFLEKWGHDLFKQAYAFKPQSTVADIVNDALVKVYNDTDERMLNVEILAQVHDSILLQIPLTQSTNDILYCINRIKEEMDPELEYFGRTFHIETDIKMGDNNWADLLEFDLGNKQELTAAIDGYKEAWRLDNGIS